MQIWLNKLDFTELYFSGNKVDALQGIFNGQPGSYKPRRLFCIQFALCLHTYKSKIKGWRADGGALSLPSYCWFSCCVATARVRAEPTVDNGLSLRSTLIDWSTFDMCIPWQLTRVFLIRSIDDLHNIISYFDRSTIDLRLRYWISRQTTFAIVIWVKSNYIVYGYRKYYCYVCSFIYFDFLCKRID